MYPDTDIRRILLFKFQIDAHGIDWDESPPEPENPEAVIADEIKFDLFNQQTRQLRRNIILKKRVIRKASPSIYKDQIF